jgi:hypothetical protein
MSTETPGNLSGAELGQFEPKSLDLRSVAVIQVEVTTSPLILLRGGNTPEDPQQPIAPPLGVELTGYRLFTTSVILGIGIPKAVYSYSGQALISSTLDWVAGIILALM